MYHWFQNLKKEDKEKRMFHFRGVFGPDWEHVWFKYSFYSGRACKLEFKIKPRKSMSICLGLLFFTMHLTFPFFSFARWIKESKTVGFYTFQWAIVGHWFKEEFESYSFYFNVDDFFLGRGEVLENEVLRVEDIEFSLGGKNFLMNKIKWHKRRQFRRFIPYFLYHRTWYSVDMKIDKPPMHSGKGENSWDCGDDGSFGVYGPWDHPIPSWKNKKESTELAIKYYVDGVLDTARRYGGSSSERGVNKNSVYKYIGYAMPKEQVQAQ